MNRRGFLGILAGAAALAAIPTMAWNEGRGLGNIGLREVSFIDPRYWLFFQDGSFCGVNEVKDFNSKDLKRVIRTEWMTMEEIRERYPRQLTEGDKS